MLTPETLKAMTPEARTQLFESLAAQFYGTGTFQRQLGEDMGYGRTTVYKWIAENTVPLPVIYTLDGWVNGNAMQASLLEDWRAIPEQLSETAAALAKISQGLAKISRRQIGAAGDGAAS